MRISKKLYIDEGVQRHSWVVWKLRRNKKIKDIYCIIYQRNGSLEIINSNMIRGKYAQGILIGLAKTRQEAIELVARIFNEVYMPNPNIQEMKDYFIKDNS